MFCCKLVFLYFHILHCHWQHVVTFFFFFFQTLPWYTAYIILYLIIVGWYSSGLHSIHSNIKCWAEKEFVLLCNILVGFFTVVQNKFYKLTYCIIFGWIPQKYQHYCRNTIVGTLFKFVLFTFLAAYTSSQ